MSASNLKTKRLPRAGRRSRAGSALVYATAVMVVMTALLSLAVDYGRVQLAKTELQQATDAAARYGMTGLPYGVAEVRQRVISSAAENKVAGDSLVIHPTNDIEFGTWDPTTRTFIVSPAAQQSSATAIRVTGKRLQSRNTGVPMFFAKLIGHNFADIKASAVAGGGQGADVLLIQDITTSFSDELSDAKLGDQAVVDTLYANGAGRTRLGILVHTGWGRTLAPLTVVGTNYSYLTSIVSSIKLAGNTGMPVASGTDIAAGFDEAIANYTAPGYTAPAGGKVVILVSDGQPSQNSSGSHPTYTDTQLLALANTRADQLWAMNVHIYVVFFDRDNDTVAANNLSSLKRGNGDFIKVSIPSQLPDALTEVTKKLPIQLVH